MQENGTIHTFVFNELVSASTNILRQTPQNKNFRPIWIYRSRNILFFLINDLDFFSLYRNLVSDIHGKTGQLLNRGTGTAQQVGGAGGAYDTQQMIRVSYKEMNHNFSGDFFLRNWLIRSLMMITDKGSGIPKKKYPEFLEIPCLVKLASNLYFLTNFGYPNR